MDNFWKDAEVISRYTREQALEDGFLVDVTTQAKEAGFVWPVAMTNEVWCECVKVPDGVQGQDIDGRLWDIFTMLRFAIKQAASTDRILFSVIVRNHNRARTTKADTVQLKAMVGGGDNGEPVITIMNPDQD